MTNYDSTPDTLRHIQTVQKFLLLFVADLQRRAVKHDASKLESPEKELFDELTPKLAAMTYGSPEYMASLEQLKPALAHHYARNSHHPEHYPNSIRGMSLMDIVEMFCDWKAATLRHNDGNIRTSIEKQQQRFGFSDELKQIFINSLSLFES